jgi:methionyl-tRNA synthetase
MPRDGRVGAWARAPAPGPAGARSRSSLRRAVAFYITTPIYYVNAAPHLGHAYTTIGVDILARHMRQRGEEVFFLTGTDEHGEPVALAAEREGVTPQELADRNAKRFEALGPLLDLSNDYFIRTSDPRHVAKVQEILTRVKDNGHVYKGLYEGWYCPRCADFKTDAEIGPENTCPIHGIALLWESEENYFFALSRFQERLERLFDGRPDFVMPPHHFNEARSFISGGLQDVSLTRGKLTWGVPVPWDEGHVFYVWFDALLNYYTALSFAREGEDLTERFWPPAYHVIGKDILKFHTVYWPALLMAAGLELPQHVFVHGFLLLDGSKMSKSLGNVLDPFEIIERFGTDALRYYCFRDVNFGRDGAVSTTAFEARYANELANELGNLASRTIAMVGRYREVALPALGLDEELGADFEGLATEVCALLDRAELTQALEVIWRRVQRLNRYVEERAPWKLARDPEQAQALGRVLASLLEGLRVVGLLLVPYLPGSMGRLLDALGIDDRTIAAARYGEGGGGGPVRALQPLFPKL